MCRAMRCTYTELNEQPAEVIDLTREFIIGEESAISAQRDAEAMKTQPGRRR